MKQIRTLGMALVAVLALSAVVASAAFAAAPEFVPSTKQSFKTSGKTATLRAASFPETVITCTASTGAGEITGAKKVGSVSVTFTGCNATSGGGCEVHSKGGGKEEISTSTLEGELGKVAKAEATSEVGLELKAGSGSFVTVEGSCIPFGKSEITGTVTGEVNPIKESGTSGTLTYAASGTSQKIKKFNGKATGLEAFIVPASQETNENITFSSAVEVN